MSPSLSAQVEHLLIAFPIDNAPADYKSIFVRSWWIDLFFYGILMAGIALANFCIVLYGYHDVSGATSRRFDLTRRVRVKLASIATLTTVRRATSFSKPVEAASRCSLLSSWVRPRQYCLLFCADDILTVHALTCKKPNRSLFKTNLLDNKLLLWCVLALSLSVFVSPMPRSYRIQLKSYCSLSYIS